MKTSNAAEVKQALLAGKIVAVPTDTVFGLLVDGLNEAAVEQLYMLKKRPKSKSLIAFVSSVQSAEQIVAVIPTFARKLIADFWPGALTCIFRTKKDSSFPFLENEESIAVRMPNNKALLELLEDMETVIVSTSANVSGEKVLTTVAMVEQQFGDEVLVWELQETSGDIMASTIIDCQADNTWKLIREGTITREKIWRSLDKI